MASYQDARARARPDRVGHDSTAPRRCPSTPRSRRVPVLLGLLLVLGGCGGDDGPDPPTGGRTWHATPDGTGSDCGTLQACLDAAADGDTVELAGGRYTAVGDTLVPAAGGLGPVVANLAIRGAPRSLVLRARAGSTPVIDGRGETGRIGLALPSNLATLEVVGLRFENCWAAIRATGGTVRLRECAFILGEHGLVADGTALDVAACLFEDHANESLLLRGCDGTLAGLEVLGSGAGLFAGASDDLRITTSRFGPFCQSALRFEEGGAARLETSTVYGAGMVQVDSTGIVVAGGATLQIDRSIVALNRGFGIDCRSGGTVVVSCSDVWGNSAGDYRGCPPATGTNGVISADPQFCSIRGALDLHLGAGSPARTASCGVMGAYGATACNPAAGARRRE